MQVTLETCQYWIPGGERTALKKFVRALGRERAYLLASDLIAELMPFVTPPDPTSPCLFVVAGLPGAGKTTLARLLAAELRAVFLRVDSLEQAMRAAGVDRIDGAGYAAAAALATDNLRLGHPVIVECVNPWPLTRDIWHAAAARAETRCVDIELVCSDPVDHRRRVETRVSDIPGLQLPTWQEVLDRDYRPWQRPRMVVDTAGRDPTDCLAELLRSLTQHRPS